MYLFIIEFIFYFLLCLNKNVYYSTFNMNKKSERLQEEKMDHVEISYKPH